MIWLINNSSDSTGYYFYSSLIQVKAAIFSIYGVFVIFKLQLLNQSNENCKDTIIRTDSVGAVTNFIEMSKQEKDKHVEHLKSRNNSLAYLFQSWRNNEKSIIEIKEQFSLPMTILVVGMIIDANALLLQQYINRVIFIEIVTYCVTLALFIWSLCLIFKSIKNIVLTK